MRRMLLRKVASRKATRLEDLAQVHILAHTQKVKARQIDALRDEAEAEKGTAGSVQRAQGRLDLLIVQHLVPY